MIQASVNTTVDGLVEAITVKLQLTEAQQALADERAAGVANWLRRPDSPLAKYSPEIFAQGSRRHGTTVRPKGRVEFDIDLVCLLHVPEGDPITPVEMYELVYDRLAAHPAYSRILERMNRCLRLSYEGDFHLDILPARPDCGRGGTCILVPDRELCCLKPSNPKGFASWFDDQATMGEKVVARHGLSEFLGVAERLQMKATLRRVTQLLKRRRDIYFDGDQYCARSIVLTTLAGMDYDGEVLCTDALISVLDTILDSFGHLVDSPIVPNPTNPDENFAEKWTRRTFQDFMDFIARFRKDMAELLELQDLEQIHAKLKEMFGEGVATDVVKEMAERLRATKDEGKLRYQGPAISLISIAAPGSRSIPRNTYHGD